MFANPYPPRVANHPFAGGLYQQIAVQTRLASATPHQMVAMLFDGYMEAVAQARGALRSGNRPAKCVAIGRAIRIIDEGLRAGLDLRSGGTLAQDLNDLYAYLSRRLTLANLHNDEAALAECQRLVEPLREAWAGIGGKAE